MSSLIGMSPSSNSGQPASRGLAGLKDVSAALLTFKELNADPFADLLSHAGQAFEIRMKALEMLAGLPRAEAKSGNGGQEPQHHDQGVIPDILRDLTGLITVPLEQH